MANTKAVIDYEQTSPIQKTRSELSNALQIQFMLCSFALIKRSIALKNYYRLDAEYESEESSLLIGQVIGVGCWVTYIFIFNVVMIKYTRIAILIFAWLGVIQLILILILIIISIIAAVEIDVHVTFLIIISIGWILSILIVVFAFRLAKLLRVEQSSQRV